MTNNQKKKNTRKQKKKKIMSNVQLNQKKKKKKKKKRKKKKKKKKRRQRPRGRKKKQWRRTISSLIFSLQFSLHSWEKNFLVGPGRKHMDPIIYFPSSSPNQTHSKKIFLLIFSSKFSLHPISHPNKHTLKV